MSCCNENYSMGKAIIFLIIFTTFSVNSQNLIDKIVVTKNEFQGKYHYTDSSLTVSDSSYSSQKKTITNKKEILKFVIEFQSDNKGKDLLSRFEIDTNYIKNNTEKLLELYSNEEKIAWNTHQKEFIFKELKKAKNYKNELDEYLSIGCCYTMHNNYKKEFTIEFFQSNNLVNKYSSRRHVWRYKLPWKDEKGNLNYNYQIEKLVNQLFKEKPENVELLKGSKLLKLLVNKIIEDNIRELYKFSAYSYLKEMDELNSKFKIISFEELYGRGRYVWDEDKIIKVTLHNEEMLPNINIEFLASVENNSLYCRDSILKDYTKILGRIQNIKFIKEYLIQNKNSRLDVFYFNNKSMTNYTIEGINKTPKEWKYYDNYLEILKINKERNPEYIHDEKAQKISERVNCGCNYRFERSFIEKGIFFELFDEYENSSIWVLLPDNKLLLYIMDNKKIMDLDIVKEEFGINFPCLLFDFEGNQIKK